LPEVDATETESPTNTSSALVENDLLPEVDATETESPTNTSTALVENDLLILSQLHLLLAINQF
jgi:hypothetical protein